MPTAKRRRAPVTLDLWATRDDTGLGDGNYGIEVSSRGRGFEPPRKVRGCPRFDVPHSLFYFYESDWRRLTGRPPQRGGTRQAITMRISFAKRKPLTGEVELFLHRDGFNYGCIALHEKGSSGEQLGRHIDTFCYGGFVAATGIRLRRGETVRVLLRTSKVRAAR